MRVMKKYILISQVIVLYLCMGYTTSGAEEPYIILDNAIASVSGSGYVKNTSVATAYDAASGFILNPGAGSKATFRINNIPGGNYDVYLEVSRAAMGIGTTPFSISINNTKEIIPVIEYGFCQKTDKSDIYDRGVFLCIKDALLKSGDRITVTALPGFEFGTVSFLPSIGNIRLYNTGAKVAEGYDDAGPKELSKSGADPLSGLKLIWLGSSVTYGQAAQGYSMADYLEEMHRCLKSYKYAISGTTLVDDKSTSYVSRMKKIPADIHPDFFIVQLSTNDAAASKPFGTLSSSKNLKDFDTRTIYGAMEYIIAYVSKTWNCRVLFYTGTYYDGDTYGNDGTAYGRMVKALLEVKGKWGIDIIDLYSDTSMRSIYNTDLYKKYMSDGVHPTAYGYRNWWGPKFEGSLVSFILAKDKSE